MPFIIPRNRLWQVGLLVTLASMPLTSVHAIMCSMFDPLYDEVGTPPDKPEIDNDSAPCNLVGNPINLLSGNKIQRETDLEGSRPADLRLERVYNSYDGIWRHNYSARLMISEVTVTYVQPDGGRQVFMAKAQGGVYPPMPTVSYGKSLDGRTLFINAQDPAYGAAGILSHSGEQWLYRAPDGTQHLFDSSGNLTGIRDIDGYTVTLVNQANTITISNQTGQTLKLVESLLHQLSSATFGQVRIDYGFVPGTERLSTVKRTEGGQVRTRTYHYEDPNGTHLLTGITDENGVRFATWRYDTSLRAISSEHAGGAGRTTLTYVNPHTTVVTNELGRKTTYSFKSIHYKRRITKIEGQPTANCPLSNSTLEYDSKGRLVAHVHENGSRTQYSYNERDLVVSQVEAAGTALARETLTEWHPQFAKPVKITRPTTITTITYDAQGRRLSTTVSKRG